MRSAWVLLVAACSASPRTETPVARTAMIADAARPPDADQDPDRDQLAGECDLCPDEPETFNGILDEDGCPDSSGTSHAVMLHPTNRLAAPIAITFTGRVSAPVEITFEPDVELVEVIGRIDGFGRQMAVNRAALIARRLRTTSKVSIVERVSAAPQLYLDDEIRDPRGDVIVQVMRGGGVQIWTWQNDQLVRATPRERMPVPKLPAGC
jgi:hypothetical protein